LFIVLGSVLHIATNLRTAFFVSTFTFGTLDKQQMAQFIGTVYMHVAWLSALVTMSDHLSVNGFAHTLVEHKIFTNKIWFQI
jgi:hypothetical protein